MNAVPIIALWKNRENSGVQFGIDGYHFIWTIRDKSSELDVGIVNLTYELCRRRFVTTCSDRDCQPPSDTTQTHALCFHARPEIFN